MIALPQTDTEYQAALIKAYVQPSDAAQMPFDVAARIACELDAQAAAALEESLISQLDLERAAAVINDTLDQVFDDTYHNLWPSWALSV